MNTIPHKLHPQVSLRGDLCYDGWSLSHLGYLYPGTTPVMIKLDESIHGVTVVIPTNHREIPGSTPGRYNLQIEITSSAYARSCGDQINIQRGGCLCSLFVALLLKKAQSKFYHPGIHGRPLARCRSPYQNLLRGYPHQQFWWGEVLPLPNIPKHSQITYGEGRPAKIGEESRRDSYSIGKECWAIFCGTDFFSFLSQFGLRVWT